MVMLRPKGKALKIAEKIMKKKGIEVKKPEKPSKTTLHPPYLQH
jgi:hypothetical protein